MPRIRRVSQDRRDLDVKLTPMIDVVFLLLVFFLWTASFQIVERTLPGSLAEETPPGEVDLLDPPLPEDDFDNVVVRLRWIDEQVQWQINEVVLESGQALRDRLALIAEIQPEAPVVLHPDPDVPLGPVIDAYDASRWAGFDQVQFAASQETGSSARLPGDV